MEKLFDVTVISRGMLVIVTSSLVTDKTETNLDGFCKVQHRRPQFISTFCQDNLGIYYRSKVLID